MTDKQIIDFMSQFVTERRLARMNEVLERRTRHITVVVEDLYQPHNASAVLRSCDCFGIQDLHVIENRNEFSMSREIHMGSANWVNTNKFKSGSNSTSDCLTSLKSQGYKIYATTPHNPDISLDEIPINSDKIALLFGTEKDGLSPEAIEMADHRVIVPMEGFTESFNISVCAAICLFFLRNRLNQSDLNWGLSDEEKEVLLLKWIRKTIKGHEKIEEEFKKNFNRNK